MVPPTCPCSNLPNLHRVYLDEFPLLDSPNPKLWLIALIVAKPKEVPALAQRLRKACPPDPTEAAHWLDLLENPAGL